MDQVKVLMRVYLEESQVAIQATGDQEAQNYFVLTDFSFNDGIYQPDTNRLDIPGDKTVP